MEVALSPDILGRTFNGVGKPLDGLPPINGEKRDVNGMPLNPVSREYPRNYIRTGISAIDGLTTLIRGQKMCIRDRASLEPGTFLNLMNFSFCVYFNNF